MGPSDYFVAGARTSCLFDLRRSLDATPRERRGVLDVGFGVLRSAPAGQAPNLNLLTIASTAARPRPKAAPESACRASCPCTARNRHACKPRADQLGPGAPTVNSPGCPRPARDTQAHPAPSPGSRR